MVIDGSSRLGKRIREGDDEVYLDNYYSNKRYLTEVISSCLNGLKVADVDISDAAAVIDASEEIDDPLDPGSVLAKSFSSARSYPGEDVPLSPLDSAMSEESDEQQFMSLSTSPSRSSTRSHNSSPTSSLPRHLHEAECCRLPPSPSDSCHPPDLRRAALMRALQIRALSPGSGCMYDPRQLQHILDRDKTSTTLPCRRGDERNDTSCGGVYRAAGAAAASRSLVLDEEVKPVEPEATAENADRSFDVSESMVPRRSRSRRRVGDDGHLSRMKRGKQQQDCVANTDKVEFSTEVSDTESSL